MYFNVSPLLLIGCIAGVYPVSYTHLDVYKRQVLEAEHFEGPAEISVTFVENAEIQRLNKQYRDKDQATDVLSLPLGQDGKYDVNQETGAAMLGDIVISMERAMAVSYTHLDVYKRQALPCARISPTASRTPRTRR